MRGYFGIGIYSPKTPENVGSLMRSASVFGADFTFMVGPHRVNHPTDTTKYWKHNPHWRFSTGTAFFGSLPHGAPVVAMELTDDAVSLTDFVHPERAVYLLGSEDNGLPPEILKRVHHVIRIPSFSKYSMNVAVAGAVVMHDRFRKGVKE